MNARVILQAPPAPGAAELTNAFVRLMSAHMQAVAVLAEFEAAGDWHLAEAGQGIVDDAFAEAVEALQRACLDVGQVAAGARKTQQQGNGQGAAGGQS